MRLRYVFSVVLIVVAFFVIYSKFKAAYYDIPLLFREANKFLLLFLVLFQALSYFGDGWLSKILLKIAVFYIKFKDTITIAILGVLGSQLTPLIGGAALTFYFYKKLKLPSSSILFLMTAWTIFISSVYLVLFILSLILLPLSYFFLIPRKVILAALIFTGVVLTLSYFLLKNQGKNLLSFLGFSTILTNKIRKFFKKKEIVMSEKPKIFLSDFYKSFSLLMVNKTKIPQAILASFLFHLSTIAVLYFSFLVFGFHPNLFILIFGLTFSWFLTIFTLMPETPGVMEASLAVVFLNLGFPPHITLFSIILYRLFSYWLPLPLGIFAYLRLKKSDK